MMLNLLTEPLRVRLVAIPLDAAAPSQRQLTRQLAIELLPRFDSEAVQVEIGKRLLRIGGVDPRERVRRRAAGGARALEERHLGAATGESIGEVRSDDAATGNGDALAHRTRRRPHGGDCHASEQPEKGSPVESAKTVGHSAEIMHETEIPSRGASQSESTL